MVKASNMEKNVIIENFEAIRMLVELALNSLNFMHLNTHGLQDFLCFLTSLSRRKIN